MTEKNTAMHFACVYLASQSPRRRELLDQIGVRFNVLSIDVPEQIKPFEPPSEYVQRLAIDKANAGKKQLQENFLKDDKNALRYWQSRKKHATMDTVIGADTAVVCDAVILGKPESVADATQMLRQLSGRRHEVLTGLAVTSGSKMLTAISRNWVTFREITDSEVERYIATKEGCDKAGGYAIQGIAAIFIEEIQGSYSGVMGLPLHETSNLLLQMGIDILPSG